MVVLEAVSWRGIEKSMQSDVIFGNKNYMYADCKKFIEKALKSGHTVKIVNTEGKNPDLDKRILELMTKGHRIDAIKLCRKEKKLYLKESKSYCEDLYDKHRGVVS